MNVGPEHWGLRSLRAFSLFTCLPLALWPLAVSAAALFHYEVSRSLIILLISCSPVVLSFSMVKGFMSLLGFSVIFIVSVCDPRVNGTHTHTHKQMKYSPGGPHIIHLFFLLRVLWSCWTKSCLSPWTRRLDCLSSSCWGSPEKTDSSEPLLESLMIVYL